MFAWLNVVRLSASSARGIKRALAKRCRPQLERLESRLPFAGLIGDPLDGTPNVTLAMMFGSAPQDLSQALSERTSEPVTIVSDPTFLSSATFSASDSSTVGAGFFHTQGNQILDAAGNVVKIAGVNWFGMETTTYSPHGLWARGYREMMDQMKQLGFNTIRLPFSNQLFDSGSRPNGIDFSKNPDLQGLSGLQIMDKIVSYAGQVGLKIILDHHRSSAGNGPEGNGLWYTSAYPESRWISDWKMLANRYAGNPTVIGADLHNEPHGGATWGSGNTSTDWRLAAERGGNAVLGINNNWLVVVEGIETGPSGYYWWGGNLSSAGAHPVRLNTPGRLVYSPHDYPASVYPQPWFNASNYPDNLRSIWDRNWGYLYRQNIAPILLGEFGSKLQTSSDALWLREMVEYLGGDLTGDGVSDLPTGKQGPSWTWWSWNPNSGDTGGILKDDWSAVQQAKVTALQPVQFEFGGTSTPPPPPPNQEPKNIPGTIQAEDYDQGGEGVAYHDSDSVNDGEAYRNDGVDVKPSSDAADSYAVGWVKAGEWLKYTVNVPTAGTYKIEARVASQYTGKHFHIEFDGVDKTGAMNVPMTGPWDTDWATITSPSFTLSAGTHTMRVYMDTDLLDLEYFVITAAAAPPAAPGATYNAAGDIAIADVDYIPPTTLAYYVSPTGSDSASGSQAAPWRTLKTAIARAPSGATIVMRGGEYREGGIGLYGKKLTIQPYHREKVWLKGSVVINNWVQDGNAWRRDGWNYRFALDTPSESLDPNYRAAPYRDMVFFDGKPLRQVLSRSEVTAGTFYLDKSTSRLYVGSNPSGKRVEGAAQAYAMDINGAAGSAIRGLGVIHYASGYNPGSLSAAALRVNSPNVTVEGCTIAYNAMVGMVVFGRNGIVRNNTIVFNGEKGLGGYKADFLLMTGSTFAYNNTEHFRKWDAAGAKLALSANMTWRNNRFENNFAPGGWLDTSCFNAIIVSNVFKGNLNQGLEFEISNKAIIASNLFVSNRDAGLQIGAGSSDVRAYNNTFVNNGTQVAVVDDNRTNSDPVFTWNTYNNTLRNNIFYASVASNPALYVRDFNSSPLRNAAALLNSSDYNAYYRSSTSATPSLVSWWNGTRQNLYSTVYAFRTATGNEAHSLAFDNMADPLFVSASQGDYTLRSDSRAKRAGQPLPADVATAIGVSSGVAVDLGRLT